MTVISYEEKLKKYLSSVLFDDACIFLSYRKKDRHHANEMMRLIHKNPMYRDMAIWYDEFLTPGENFNENIGKALEKSDLITLLVTPNLVNEDNYVQKVEYPEALRSGKSILPAEMVETDRDELNQKYEEIPNPVDAHKETELDQGMREALKKLSLKQNDTDPEHNYLIGLAYLEGIDVETDSERALELIASVAGDELPEAIEKLYDLYSEGKT